MAEFVIRDAVVGDADALGRVHVRAWQAAYRGVMPDEYLDGLSAVDRAEMWRGRIARTDLTPLLVAVVDDEPVGFATYGAEQPSDDATESGQLYAMNVDPDHWGGGIGRALLRRATDALAAAGYRDAVLWVVPENARARALYESEGWVDDHALATEEILGVTVRDMRLRTRLGTD